MHIATARAAAAAVLLPGLLWLMGSAGLASHESTNRLEFAPVADSPAPASSGEGTIEFHGGSEPTSRWTVSFRFTGLAPGAAYAVVDLGRFGEDGSPQATEFTALCAFSTDGAGAGGCWDYLFGLRRANVLQLRADDPAGPVVLQATRDPAGPGAIASVPNRFSPPPAATPRPLPIASPTSQ